MEEEMIRCKHCENKLTEAELSYSTTCRECLDKFEDEYQAFLEAKED